MIFFLYFLLEILDIYIYIYNSSRRQCVFFRMLYQDFRECLWNHESEQNMYWLVAQVKVTNVFSLLSQRIHTEYSGVVLFDLSD